MEQLIVTGKTILAGEVNIHGAKNAALPILCATVLSRGSVTLYNVPKISDVSITLEILKFLGAKVHIDIIKNAITIDATEIYVDTVPVELVNQMRASILFLGGLVGRLGQVNIGYPGGCKIGARPIDLHLSGLEAIGVTITEDEKGNIVATGGSKLKGGIVDLRFPSVGATQNIILGAVLADGTTIIKGAAIEPEIIDMIYMLNNCGARIGVKGSTIVVQGVKEIGSGHHRIMSDRIVAGTYLAGAAITRGNIVIHGPEKIYMRSIIEPFEAMGMDISFDNDILIVKSGNLVAIDVVTMPHPGFPTDVGPQLMTAMCFAKGVSTLEETLFETRDKHVAELNKMGANITILEEFENTKKSTFIINQTKELYGGQTVYSKDLRGGAALVLAAMAAEGATVVQGYEYIARGYEDIARDLNMLGANIVVEQSKEIIA